MTKFYAPTGEGLSQPKIGQHGISTPTMSSLEMVDYINAERQLKAEEEGMPFPCKKYRKLEHRSFMKKVPNVLGNAAEKFFATDTYINGTGGVVERDICNFPKREACLMAMSYSYELQAKVYDYMEELDRQAHGYLNYSVQELQDIVAGARKVSDEDSSDAGRRLRKRQDDLVLLEKAESLVESLSQLKLDFIGSDRDKEIH
ncbi:Rha family transcriptional regulator [Enterobacter roggenkampii]|uniref:Rha family transcriptional regulator n=1 Tax=Enterobacter roggenkampii TaxID=1812935 RepID=UPI000BA8C133|nr:Rha family transcriptional regulator [Enterobacter roggenkampii]MCM7723698.1 Rha family transcriptional regulator [Enterobacter roggenkampii]PAO22486.1 Rha family transcriptional regulator [Enterobacter roggenkampii]